MANRYWVGGSGSWFSGSTANWSATSGGASGASVPTSADDVFFNANSGGGTVNKSGAVPCASLNMTGFSGTFNSSGLGDLTVSGSVTIPSTVFLDTGWVSTTSNLVINPSSASTVDINVTWPTNITFSGTSTATLQRNLVVGPNGGTTVGVLTLTSGTFDAATYNVTANFFVSNSGTVRTLSLGSGTWTLRHTFGTIWDVTSTNLTLNSGTSTIVFLRTALSGGSGRTFAGGGLTYYNLTISNDTANPNVFTDITGGNTFNIFSSTLTAAHLLRFSAFVTNTFNEFTVSGSSGNIISLNSISAGSRINLSKASGAVNSNFLSIRDNNATGGATWTATNSTNVSNNIGWVFSTSSSVTVNLTSVFGNSQLGTVTILSNSAITNVTNVTGTTALGAATVPSTSFNISGVSGTVSVGTVTVPNVSFNVFGTSGTTALGTAVLPNVSFTLNGVTGFSILGDVTVTTNTATPSGVYGTGQIGNASTNAIFSVDGVYGTGVVGSVALWFDINTAQNSTWVGVNTLQI
jgi:hypothetical protein